MNSKVLGVSRLLLSIALLINLQAWAEDAPWLLDARKVASAVPLKLLEVLNPQIAKDGLASAVAVCNEKAPRMARMRLISFCVQ